MRIDPTKLAPLSELQPHDKRTTDSERSTPASVVELTSAGDSGAVDRAIAERISRVRELISTGQYAVDLDQLASNIVDDDIMRSK